MRDSLLRVVDDIETKIEEMEGLRDGSKSTTSRAFFDGHVYALNYALREIKKVLEDHADSNRV